MTDSRRVRFSPSTKTYNKIPEWFPKQRGMTTDELLRRIKERIEERRHKRRVEELLRQSKYQAKMRRFFLI